jgi:hypothetical protein
MAPAPSHVASTAKAAQTRWSRVGIASSVDSSVVEAVLHRRDHLGRDAGGRLIGWVTALRLARLRTLAASPGQSSDDPGSSSGSGGGDESDSSGSGSDSDDTGSDETGSNDSGSEDSGAEDDD